MSPRRRKPPAPGAGQGDPRGGQRVGTQGAAYANRKDLNQGPRQAVRAVPSQQYGQRAAQERSQQAIPLPAAPPPGGQPTQAAAGGGYGPGFVPPDAVPTFGDPTSRPDEPVTAGLPFGPGRNPSPFDQPPSPARNEVAERIRALYLAFPTPELRELIEDMEVGD